MLFLGTKCDVAEPTSGSALVDPTWAAALSWARQRAALRWRSRIYRALHFSMLFLPRMSPKVPLESGENPFDSLPDEVILNIVRFLNTPDIGRLAATCTRFHCVLSDPSVRHSSSYIHIY